MPALPPILLEYVRARAGGDSFAFEPGPQIYLVRAPGGGFRELHFHWDEALLADLSLVSGPRPNPSAAARVGERLRAFIHDTPLHAVESALGAGSDARVHMTSAAAELYALPWELLALRPSGLWLGQLAELSLSYGWPEARPHPLQVEPAPEGGRLLLAWSEAGGSVPWRAHGEAIQRACAGVLRFDPAQDVLPDATPTRVAAALAQVRGAGRPFTVIHLLSHGVTGPEGGSLLLDPRGPTDPAALRGLLAPHLDTVRLVVLCACQSAAVGSLGGALGGAALALHRAGAEAVVGARQPLPIEASVALTEALYTSLLQRSNSLERAFIEARRALQNLGPGSATAGLQLWRHDPERGDTRPFVIRPYRGLLAFEAPDARFFFGRDVERDLLLDRVLRASRGEAPRFQVLCGATGSGKSSLIRAGLLPRLAEAGWKAALVRPASAPIAALDEALDALEEGQQLLVVVDPMQELFTAVPDPEERQAIAAALWEASLDTRVVVLAGIRVDYLGRCEEIHLDRGSRRLDALLYDEAHRIFLAAPGPAELRAAALGPLDAVGLEFEAGLLDALMADAGTEPGALPALQHTLDCLWARRRGRTLTHAAYRALGAISGALASWADQVLAALSPEEQAAARQLLVSLVTFGHDERMASHRARRLSELLPADPAARAPAERALEALVSGRLVVVGEQSGEVGAEIAHEALLRRWETLRGWVEEDIELHRRREQLVVAAGEWRLHLRDPDQGAPWLLRGSRLLYAEEMLAARALPEDVVAYIEASRAAEQEMERHRMAELAERERLAHEALAAASRARDSALLASARAWREPDPTLALQLLREVEAPEQPLDWAREAWAVLAGPVVTETWALGCPPAGLFVGPAGSATALLQRGAICARRPLDGDDTALFEAEANLRAAAWSPDGRAIFATTSTGDLLYWDGSNLHSLERGGPQADRIRVSPDGGRVALGLADGRVRVLSVRGEVISTLRGHVGAVLDLDWRADGRALLSASVDGTARLWDPASGAVTVFRGFDSAVTAARFAPDGRAFAAVSRDGSLRLWELPRGVERIRRELGAPGLCAAWGGALLVGDASGRVTSLGPEGAVRRVLSGTHGPIVGVAWDGEGRPLSTSEDGTLRRWRIEPGPVPTVIGLSLRRAGDLRWSPDGQRIAGAGGDGLTTVLCPDSPGIQPVILTGHREAVRELAWSPDGATLLSVSNDDSARLWRTVDGQPRGMLLGHSSAVTTAAWSPNGRAMATGDADGVVLLWAAEGHRQLGGCTLENEAASLSFSRDGSWLLALGADRTARLIPVEGGEPWSLGVAWTRRAQGAPGRAFAAACWSGDHVVLGALDGSVLEADPRDRTLRSRARLGAAITALDADGRRIVLATEDGGVQLGLGDGAVSLNRPGAPYAKRLMLQPGGRLLVGLDHADGLWVVDLRSPGDRVMSPGKSKVVLAALSPQGDRVAAACDDGMIRVWPLGTARLIDMLRAASAAELSPEQRAGSGLNDELHLQRRDGLRFNVES